MSRDYLIRQFAFHKDYDRVIALWENAGSGIHLGPSDTPEEIKKKIEHFPDLFLVAEADGRIIGSVLGGFDGRRGMVYHLAVAHGWRNLGLGEALMTKLEELFKEKKCLRSYLLVTRDNEDAIRFYEKRGWERMDLLVFGKNIE